MRAVRADGKQELEQQLVGGRVTAETNAAVLAADLTELAWPVGQHQCSATVAHVRIVCAIRIVVTRAGEPAATELVVARHVVAERALDRARLLAAAPDQLRSSDYGLVNRPLQRPPAQTRVDSPQVGDEPAQINA